MDASYPPHYTKSFDTITSVYNLMQLESDQLLRLPDEFVGMQEPPVYDARIKPETVFKKAVLKANHHREEAKTRKTY